MLPPPEFESHPLRLVWKLLTTVWHPVQFAGIVLLVLIFVLLEHESLRDRFIRIAGATDIRSATLALNDAGDRLSRYFVSQFAVNLAFGLAIWMSLSMLRLPQALLCGILAGVMRFVPYVGVAIAALFAAVLALAVDPGWSLALSTLGVFILLDIVVGQLVEPHLYGHATGLSPLSVVVGAIFWSWLWGPAGLILSTPLTLCLLVAGRHMKGLGVLEVLLGNATAVDVTAEVLPTGAVRRFPRDHRRRAGFWAGRHRLGVVAHGRDAGMFFGATATSMLRTKIVEEYRGLKRRDFKSQPSSFPPNPEALNAPEPKSCLCKEWLSPVVIGHQRPRSSRCQFQSRLESGPRCQRHHQRVDVLGQSLRTASELCP